MMLLIVNVNLVIFCLLVICVRTSDAIFLPGIMFPLMVGRGSLYGIFGLIGVGMCYFLALLSLSSIDYLHKRRRENSDRIDTLRNNLLNSPLMQQMQQSMDDYNYNLQREQDYYDSPIDDQSTDDKGDLYYNQPSIAAKQSQPYYPNKFNGPQYKPNNDPQYVQPYRQVPYPAIPNQQYPTNGYLQNKNVQQYVQPYKQRPYASMPNQQYPTNEYPQNKNYNPNPGLYRSPSDSTYIKQRPPNRRFVKRMRRSIGSKNLLENKMIVTLLLGLDKNSPRDKFMILYRELSLIRQNILN